MFLTIHFNDNSINFSIFFIYRFQLAFESFPLLSNYTKASDVLSTI